ncbi:MAG: DUF2284 domain-containing protein [Methanobacteriaceae archaeon]|jgi:predicted metal-binding protein|nr:DUF2284 domain-containing protein [Methanobacteriaceae archaeon]
MYTVEEFTAKISADDYIKDFVDVDYFLEFCKSCPNYERNWGCPPFNFDPLELWKKYDNLLIIGVKISFDDDISNKKYSSDELSNIISKSLRFEKNKLFNKLMQMEKELENSVCLSAGTCNLCKECVRIKNEECIHPDKLRHSMESLGANVQKTIEELLNIKINWINDYKLPKYLTLCGGLLY